MKKIITIIFLLFFISVNAQKVKKRTSKTALGETEIYYVLKSDKKVKHGKYLVKNPFSNNLRVTGEYAFGEKHGLWIEYNILCNKIRSRGYYKKGKRIGKWKFFDYTGKFIQEYDYDAKKIIASKEVERVKEYPKLLEYEVFINDSLVITTLDSPPSCIGGRCNLIYEIGEKFYEIRDHPMDDYDFKKKYDLTEEYASIDFSVLIKRDGTTGDIKNNDAISNPNIVFGVDTFNFIKSEIESRKGQWLVAEKNGEKVDAYIKMVFGITYYSRKEK